MKINFVLPHLKIAGGVRIVLSYADQLARRGHQVTVVVPERSFARRLWRNLSGFKPSWFVSLTAHTRFISSWDKGVLPPADVTVADSWQAARFLSSVKSAGAGAKVHMIQHDERLYHGPREEVDSVYKKELAKIVTSTWLKETIKNDYGVDALLLSTPIDKELFHQVPLDKDQGSVRVLMLNHSYEWKGVVDGLEAYRSVKAKYPKVTLVMFGVRGERPELCDEYYSNPPQEELAKIYSSCDIYLCPSWDEGEGLPPKEAMACGLALVTYNNGGSWDYAHDNQTALVAERRDVDDLALKLEKLVGDEELRKRISQEGKKFIENLPTWKEQTDKMEKFLEEQVARQKTKNYQNA